MSFSRRSYEEIASDLNAACDWLNKLGFSYNGTRIAIYQNCLNSLSRHYKDGTIDEFNKKYKLVEFVNSAQEAAELVAIHRGLNTYDASVLRRKIDKLLSGNEFKNQDRNSLPRSIAFELSIAARFSEAGYAVDFDTTADMKFKYEDKYVFVECKRNKSKRKVVKNISEAFSQLGVRYKKECTDSCFGIAAFSISDLLNRGDLFLMAKNDKEVGEKAHAYCVEHIATYEKNWMNQEDARSIGVLIELDTPSITEDNNLISTCRVVDAKSTDSTKGKGEEEFLKIMKPLL